MKTTTKKIITGFVLSILCLSQTVVIAFADSKYTDEENAACKAQSVNYAAYGNKALTCDEMDVLNNKIDNNQTKSGFSKEENIACMNQSKGMAAYGNQPLSCDQMNAVNAQIESEQKAEADCKAKFGTTCAEQGGKIQMASGQGFKLPLDFLTLETKDKNGKVQKQGTSIFYNKDYSKYGVLLGTLLRVIDILIYVIGSVALLTLVVAGIMMIANHGDEGWVTKGKDMMLYSILGVLFALLSFAVVNVITSILS